MGNIIDKDFEELELLAQEYEEQEIEFEAEMIVLLNSFWKKTDDYFKSSFDLNQEVPSFSPFKQELETILKDSYADAMDFSSRHFERELELQANGSDEDLAIQSAVLLALLEGVRGDIEDAIDDFILDRAPKQADIILKTTFDVYDDEVKKARMAIWDNEGDVNKESTLNEIGRQGRDANEGRSGTIAQTEIGTASEEGAEVEDEILQGTIAISMDHILKSIKTWFTRGDSVVRPAHAHANGQERERKQPFEVGGELLRYPKDMSLGASLGNIINCRCKALRS